MYAITGITGRVGGATAKALLRAGQQVRAVTRDASKARAWLERGCELAPSTMNDAATLTAAFEGCKAVFILPPPEFDPSPGFPEARAVVAAVKTALEAARPSRVVCLSTVGAQAPHENLLTQRTILEQALAALPLPIAFLRPAWFMENAEWDAALARDAGTFSSFLQPLDRPLPMVATADVGRVAASLLQETWRGRRVVELEGPRRVTPLDVAAAFSRIFGRTVRAEAVPRTTWGALFKAQGMKDPVPRIQMLDGFNEGWLDFESGVTGTLKGEVELEAVLRGLVGSDSPSAF